jgi:hypothetical protein
MEERLALPAGSLTIPPSPTLPEGLHWQDAWIHQRRRPTHDRLAWGCHEPLSAMALDGFITKQGTSP